MLDFAHTSIQSGVGCHLSGNPSLCLCKTVQAVLQTLEVFVVNVPVRTSKLLLQLQL
jgi:hypothetical protein